jgi:putative spermidine/putrescine transport system permease protein
MYATESIDPMMASVSTLVIFITAGAMLLLDRAYGLNRILIGQH